MSILTDKDIQAIQVRNQKGQSNERNNDMTNPTTQKPTAEQIKQWGKKTVCADLSPWDYDFAALAYQAGHAAALAELRAGGVELTSEMIFWLTDNPNSGDIRDTLQDYGNRRAAAANQRIEELENECRAWALTVDNLEANLCPNAPQTAT